MEGIQLSLFLSPEIQHMTVYKAFFFSFLFKFSLFHFFETFFSLCWKEFLSVGIFREKVTTTTTTIKRNSIHLWWKFTWVNAQVNNCKKVYGVSSIYRYRPHILKKKKKETPIKSIFFSFCWQMWNFDTLATFISGILIPIDFNMAFEIFFIKPLLNQESVISFLFGVYACHTVYMRI